MKVKYVKSHNNYDLTIGKIYHSTRYKDGWLLITEDDKGNRVLYREECFEIKEE
jgi:hypothetical protein